MTKKILAFVAPVLVVASSGCLIVDHEPPGDPYGDIAFSWSFDGISDCDEAGVDELDLAIFRDGALVDQIQGEPCVGGGLVLTDFLEGRYEIDIDAYNRSSELLYAGGFTIRVVGGIENDAGLIVLERIGEPPPPDDGAVDLLWTFLYPANSAIESCAVAGVVDIDVLLEGPGGAQVNDTFDCASAAGATFDHLEPGTWTLHVDAYGRYHNDSIHLYGDSINVVVVANNVTEVGELALPRDEDSFADVEAAWSFAASSCAAEGISELTLSVQRSGLDHAEDVTTVQCSSVSAVRRTFVPGSYTVSLEGVGTVDTWLGFASVDVAPNTTTQVNIQLTPGA